MGPISAPNGLLCTGNQPCDAGSKFTRRALFDDAIDVAYRNLCGAARCAPIGRTRPRPAEISILSAMDPVMMMVVVMVMMVHRLG
jgi:hypothetical protein